MVTRFVRSGAVLLFLSAMPVHPSSAATKAIPSASPTSFVLQANVGTSVPSATVQVRNAGGGTLYWSVPAPNGKWPIWLSVSPTSGVNSGTLTLTFNTSTLKKGFYQTSFRVNSSIGSGVTVYVKVTITAPPPAPPTPPLLVTCPANMSLASSDGSSVVATYSATTSGGVAPVTLSSNPTSGSSFAVGTTSVVATAQASNGQTASCGFSVTVTHSPTQPPPPPPSSSFGPLSTITCPVGAIEIGPGTVIQTLVNIHPRNTTFCIRAGLHPVTSMIVPKSGDIFVGEFGAILDGSGWSTTDPDQAAFRALNEDIDDVSIRNLVIRNMPQRGIFAFKDYADRWTIENNEISGNVIGVAAPNHSMVRNNYIHHNSGGGYTGYRIIGTTFEHNEISYNGRHKILGSTDVTFRNNFVHHNLVDGIWYDTENTNGIIEGNRVEDNGREGIFYEISQNGTIRGNIVSRNVEYGIFISTSKNVEVYGNTVEDNEVGIEFFLNCELVGDGTIGFDLADVYAHDNTVKVGTASNTYASGFVYLSSCTSAQVIPYVNGSKNLRFENQRYTVPNPSARYWFWDSAVSNIGVSGSAFHRIPMAR